MKLGLRRGTVALEPHNTEWERTAMQTIAKLRELLPDVIIDAQHIGSTAIKGISAKPIIDIVIGVADFDDILSHNDILARMDSSSANRISPRNIYMSAAIMK